MRVAVVMRMIMPVVIRMVMVMVVVVVVLKVMVMVVTLRGGRMGMRGCAPVILLRGIVSMSMLAIVRMVMSMRFVSCHCAYLTLLEQGSA
jgi:hypothetical protein